MCESSAYLLTPEGETKIMDYVVDIIPNDDGSLTLSDLLGGTKIVQGKLKEVKLLNHKIIIEEKAV
ncbi:CooT family nickel-binding protein [Eubacteriaceae bacterium ES3]|nr:CooT family nickel-binding protein [Eubacteriaceae bacterium ES3]